MIVKVLVDVVTVSLVNHVFKTESYHKLSLLNFDTLKFVSSCMVQIVGLPETVIVSVYASDTLATSSILLHN